MQDGSRSQKSNRGLTLIHQKFISISITINQILNKMLYTIGTSNNYPSRAYGAFRSVKGSITDYLIFGDPAPIHLNIRIDFTDFEAIAAKWDCISIDKVYTIC